MSDDGSGKTVVCPYCHRRLDHGPDPTTGVVVCGGCGKRITRPEERPQAMVAAGAAKPTAAGGEEELRLMDESPKPRVRCCECGQALPEGGLVCTKCGWVVGAVHRVTVPLKNHGLVSAKEENLADALRLVCQPGVLVFAAMRSGALVFYMAGIWVFALIVAWLVFVAKSQWQDTLFHWSVDIWGWAVRLAAWLLLAAWWCRTLLGVVERVPASGVWEETDRSLLACLWRFATVSGIAVLPPIISTTVAMGLAVIFPPMVLAMVAPLLLLAAGWTVYYAPLGLATAGAVGTLNPLPVLRKAWQTWPAYLLVLLFVWSLWCVTVVAIDGVNIYLDRAVLARTREFQLCVAFGLLLVQAACLSFVALELAAVLGGFFRRYADARRWHWRELRSSLPWAAGAVMIAASAFWLRLTPTWTNNPVTRAQAEGRMVELVDRMAGEQARSHGWLLNGDWPTEAAGIARRDPTIFARARDRLLGPPGGPREQRQRAIGRVAVRLMMARDPRPAMHLTPEYGSAYKEILQVAAQVHGTDWLLDLSCDRSPQVRVFAADALRLSLPLQALPPEAVAQLAEPMTPSAKRERYEQVQRDAADWLEKALVGRYNLLFEGTWKDAAGNESRRSFHTAQPVLTVARAGDTWTLRGSAREELEGPLAEITTKSLQVRVEASFLVWEAADQAESIGPLSVQLTATELACTVDLKAPGWQALGYAPCLAHGGAPSVLAATALEPEGQMDAAAVRHGMILLASRRGTIRERPVPRTVPLPTPRNTPERWDHLPVVRAGWTSLRVKAVRVVAP